MFERHSLQQATGAPEHVQKRLDSFATEAQTET